MIEMMNEEANSYSRILKALGMEEEGNPVAAVELMLETLRGIADADWRLKSLCFGRSAVQTTH